MHHNKLQIEDNRFVQIIFLNDELHERAKALNFGKFLWNYHWRHCHYNAVTRVVPEFSCHRVSFLQYDFYAATWAISLGVLLKRPHQNWKVSPHNKWKMADMGQNGKTSRLMIWRRFEHCLSFPMVSSYHPAYLPWGVCLPNLQLI